jgi:hypothetical protein
MSISKSVRWIVALGAFTVVPLLAQSTATAPTQTVGTNPAASNPTATTTSKTTTTATTTTTKTTTHKTHHAKHPAGSSKASVLSDATRLGAVLQDVQTNATVPAATWKSVGNEADVLANRIYSHTAGDAKAHKIAKDLRMHVREMQSAAKGGDAAGAKTHASQALPYANQLADWATPAKT